MDKNIAMAALAKLQAKKSAAKKSKASAPIEGKETVSVVSGEEQTQPIQPAREHLQATTEISIELTRKTATPNLDEPVKVWSGLERITETGWCWRQHCPNCSVDAPGSAVARWWCGRRDSGKPGEKDGVVWRLIKEGVLVKQCPKLKTGELKLEETT